MAAIENASFFGQFTRALNQDQLDTLRAYTKGLGYVPLDTVLQNPPSVFPLVMSLGSDPNNGTVSCMPYKVPFPVKCWGVDLGCLSAAGSAATGNILRDPLGGGSPVTIFTAAKDIKTAAGDFTRYAPLSGSELWDYSDEIIFTVIGTGSGAVVEARAVLWLQKL
jgi:hypothetical protein